MSICAILLKSKWKNVEVKSMFQCQTDNVVVKLEMSCKNLYYMWNVYKFFSDRAKENH